MMSYSARGCSFANPIGAGWLYRRNDYGSNTELLYEPAVVDICCFVTSAHLNDPCSHCSCLVNFVEAASRAILCADYCLL